MRHRKTRIVSGLGAAMLFAVVSSPAYAFICPADPPGFGTPDEAQCGNPEFQSCGIDVNGITRHFCIHVPDDGANPPAGSDPLTEAMPVIFGFHGGGGDAAKMMTIWDKHTEQGMVLVAPSALVSWNGLGCHTAWRSIGGGAATWAELANQDACGNGTQTVPAHLQALPYQSGGDYHDDLDLVRELSVAIEADPDIEPTGVYASGFSSGAGMVFQLFITKPHVSVFDGFAAVSNIMTLPKVRAQRAAAGIPGYTPNADVRTPFLYIIGTNDKMNAPRESMVEFVDHSGVCPAVTSAVDVLMCWASHPAYPLPDTGKHDMYTPGFLTIQWLVRHNRSLARPLQSLYPDVGHGDAPYSVSDHTMVVRQDFLKRPNADDSEPVAALRVIDGGHSWPGNSGDYPSCPENNCDIDASEVILQFWRAHAGLQSAWP